MTIPKREGSVMENLVDMRDHLKATRAAMQAGVDPLRAASGRHTPAAAAAADPRERREFEERLARDRASVALRLEEAERDAGELRVCRESLEAVAAELAALPDADPQTIADLRLRHQQIAGRISALRGSGAAAAGIAGTETRSAETIWRETAPLAVAILLGAGIIAGTLLLLLG